MVFITKKNRFQSWNQKSEVWPNLEVLQFWTGWSYNTLYNPNPKWLGTFWVTYTYRLLKRMELLGTKLMEK